MLSALPGSQGFCLWPDGSLEVIMLPGMLNEWYKNSDLLCVGDLTIRLSLLRIAESKRSLRPAAKKKKALLLHAFSGRPIRSDKTRPFAQTTCRTNRSEPLWCGRKFPKKSYQCKTSTRHVEKQSHGVPELYLERYGGTAITEPSVLPDHIEKHSLQVSLSGVDLLSSRLGPSDASGTVIDRTKERNQHDPFDNDTSTAENEGDIMPPGVLPTANGAHAAKRTASPESEANGIVQQPVMDTISRASTPPEDVPPPPIPPPLAPLEEGLEVILLPEPPPVRWLRAPCHIKVGLAISTAGVQVRRPGSNEHYLTISTHAAYEGSCKKPLPYCKPKSRGIFGKRSIKQLPELVGVSVHEATVGGVEVRVLPCSKNH